MADLAGKSLRNQHTLIRHSGEVEREGFETIRRLHVFLVVRPQQTRQSLVEILLVDAQRSKLFAPARCRELPAEPILKIVDQQRLVGTLPKRPEMLEAAPLASAEDWCENRDVPMRPTTIDEYRAHPEGKHTVDWVDETPRLQP